MPRLAGHAALSSSMAANDPNGDGYTDYMYNDGDTHDAAVEALPTASGHRGPHLARKWPLRNDTDQQRYEKLANTAQKMQQPVAPESGRVC